MPLYYFHVQDSEVEFDDLGLDLADLNAVRASAVRECAAMLQDGVGPRFWSGAPWRLWVTDQPDGKGKVVCELHFSALVSKRKLPD